MNRLLKLAFVFVSITATAFAQTRSEHKPHDHHAHTELSSGNFSKDSLYQLESTWSVSPGRSVRLSSFRGKPQILTMFYSTCTSACPILVTHVQQIQREFEKRGIEASYIFITFDPTRDSRESLDAYAAKRDLSLPEWSFLRGSPSDTQDIAVLLGMKYKEVADGSFAHSNIITLIDSDGRIAHRHSGLALTPADIDKFASTLAHAHKKK